MAVSTLRGVRARVDEWARWRRAAVLVGVPLNGAIRRSMNEWAAAVEAEVAEREHVVAQRKHLRLLAFPDEREGL